MKSTCIDPGWYKKNQWCQKRFLLHHLPLRLKYPVKEQKMPQNHFLESSVSICRVFHAYLPYCDIHGPSDSFILDCFCTWSTDTVYNLSLVVSSPGKQSPQACLYVEIFAFQESTNLTKLLFILYSSMVCLKYNNIRFVAKLVSSVQLFLPSSD